MMSAIKMMIGAGLLLLCVPYTAFAQVVLEHDGVSISQGELEYLVNQWPDQMKRAAANDEGDRLELLNRELTVKKLAREADKIPVGTEAYWRLANKITQEKRKFVLQEYVRTLEVPDMSELAAERYTTEKEKYARVLERRQSSHILFGCPPGKCSREEMKASAQKILDELRAGADFESMVGVHSDDPGSKAKGGKFDKWIGRGEVGVAGPYSQGVFQVGEVGEYSELVSTQFGIHIIRLDAVQEEHYLPYDEVKAKIVADLETEYRKLSLSNYMRDFNMTEDVYIDGNAMEEIFAPYQSKSE
jgi:peptidyl-prolyl cis-trans isomerase C